MGPNETLLTAKEFASQSGLSVAQVTKLLRENKLQGHKLSGKWMIPASALKKSDTPPPAANAKQVVTAKTAQSSPADPKMSVADFSAKTYLTEAGVIQWLKKGRLKGTRTSGGEWQVDATSLELPTVKHLRRP